MTTEDPRPRRPPGRPQKPATEPGVERLRDATRSGDLDHPVLAGYDGSPSSRHALAYAAGMARRLGRPLVLVYVCPGVYCEPLSGQVIGAGRDEAELGRWLMAELSQVTDPDDLVVRGILRRGNPARELAAAAAAASADGLVVGAPGRVWHHVAGSVPGWLSRHANCPVIVVP
jgi:nucleotide-binding universal stress UspA family protein